jgi:HlyD family secretion protein
MTATATIVTNSRKDVLLVPNAALRYTPPAPQGGAPPDWAMQKRGSEVWTPAGGDPAPVPVVTGGTDGQVTEVVSGPVTVGMPLITGTLESLE